MENPWSLFLWMLDLNDMHHWTQNITVKESSPTGTRLYAFLLCFVLVPLWLLFQTVVLLHSSWSWWWWWWWWWWCCLLWLPWSGFGKLNSKCNLIPEQLNELYIFEWAAIFPPAIPTFGVPPYPMIYWSVTTWTSDHLLISYREMYHLHKYKRELFASILTKFKAPTLIYRGALHQRCSCNDRTKRNYRLGAVEERKWISFLIVCGGRVTCDVHTLA